jgi:hypothetical protein
MLYHSTVFFFPKVLITSTPLCLTILLNILKSSQSKSFTACFDRRCYHQGMIFVGEETDVYRHGT